MAIDFTLTKQQQDLRDAARDFAESVLAPIVRDADGSPDPHEAFAKTKPAYVEAYKRGQPCSNWHSTGFTWARNQSIDLK